MDISRKAVSGTVIALVVVIVVILVGFAAYAVYYAPGATTVTSVTTATTATTATSIATSVATSVTTATTATTATATSVTTATSATTATSVTTATSSYLGSASIIGAGSTLVNPVMTSWIFGFTLLQPNIQITYNPIGSGAGIAQITAGTVNFGASDAPLTSTQYGALPSGSTLLTIPESASGVIPAYNIPGIASTTHLRFNGSVLAQIFLGNITMWNAPALAQLNPTVNLPADAITVVHRSDGSGTMYAFTNYLSDSSAHWAKFVGTSTSVKWPVGIGCKGNAGVAGCIQNTQYSIGPLEIAYQIQNPTLINYGSVENHAGNFILANLTNIALALKAGASAGLPAGNAAWTGFSIINNIYNDSADTQVYPITTFTYIMVYQDLSASYAGTSQAQANGMVNFIWWVVNSGQNAGAGLGYPALPANVVSLDDTTLMSITYNGTPVYTGS
jgi:phosphate ABC transporter phosphate-binding protein